MRRSVMAVVVAAVMAPLVLSACGDRQAGEPGSKQAGGQTGELGSNEGSKQAVEQGGKQAGASPGASAGAERTESGTAAATGPISLTVTPSAGKRDLPVSTEIAFTVGGGTVTTVTLTDAKGATVPGALREDGSAWVPSRSLKTRQAYTASVVATGAGGGSKTVTTSFTTMGAPAHRTGTGLYLFDGHTYGVAMPVVVEFSPGIKKADRAAVQRRMFVSTSPAQPGTWSWTPSGTQAYYRAPTFWRSGTKLSVRIAVGGVPTGGGRYGDRDRAATARIGRDFEMRVDNASKEMTVVQGGKVLKTLPVSLGKRSTPSSSGTMVVMDKLAETVFDTTDTDPVNGYKTKIQYAQRLTWSGQYIHSAPWSTGAQGHRNVSHGCVNVAPAQAVWLFDHTLIGDPVIVKGTGNELVYGNGWTPWDVSWAAFAKGSALPVPAGLG